MVRCSACGAPRTGAATACDRCGSSFTLADRDLQGTCPACLTRVGRASRFCPACGTAIRTAPATATDRTCPACGPSARLTRRPLDGGFARDECERCAGLWLDAGAFRELVARAESFASGLHGPAERAGPDPAEGTGTRGPMYRPCVSCGTLMQRQNYGRRSGVIIDVCRDHGAWFDAHEIARILDWVRAGGLDRARAAEREQADRAARRAGRGRTELDLTSVADSLDDPLLAGLLDFLR